jgi:hypothetical protein
MPKNWHDLCAAAHRRLKMPDNHKDVQIDPRATVTPLDHINWQHNTVWHSFQKPAKRPDKRRTRIGLIKILPQDHGTMAVQPNTRIWHFERIQPRTRPHLLHTTRSATDKLIETGPIPQVNWFSPSDKVPFGTGQESKNY